MTMISVARSAVAIPSNSPREYTAPDGFDGLFITSARVRGVIASEISDVGRGVEVRLSGAEADDIDAAFAHHAGLVGDCERGRRGQGLDPFGKSGRHGGFCTAFPGECPTTSFGPARAWSIIIRPWPSAM